MRTEVSEVLVRAPRVTLDEILDRVARGEARRDSLLRDQSFTATLRVMTNTTGKRSPELFAETVARVYRKKPGLVRTVTLRAYQRHPDRDSTDQALESDFSPSMGEEIVNFAFRPAHRRNYRFRIEDRKLLGDHLLYTLRFEPRSALAVYEPAGRVWVDTKDYVIVRQELEFRQSPVPLFLKSIRRMVVERSRAGEFWVLSRALVRMELTVPMPKLGRSLDFGMAFTDYQVNQGLPDSLFAAPGAAAERSRVRVRVGGGRRRS
jgi:outer membrane lipoprotein-sorting protein